MIKERYLLSFITDMFNTNKGSNFNANVAGITSPTDAQQLAEAHGATQSGLSQQQQFVNALQAQNGIGNQSQVYNQLQDIAAGRGPNPAMAALANATGANTSNQAALMAGQRGASQNAGLIARQAAQQGAANQQNAIGQGAALQAQQSMNAIGQAGQMAGQQVGQQAGALGTYNQLAQNNQGMQQTAAEQMNATNVANTKQQNDANSGIAKVNAENQNKMGSGVLSGAGKLIGLAEGGEVPKANFWENHMKGMISDAFAPAAQAPVAAAPKPDNAETLGNQIGTALADGGKQFAAQVASGFAKGGKVKAMVSPGERYLPPEAAEAVAEGKKDPMKAGVKIPGKAKYKGNDYRNDTVNMTLEEGGIVLPKSVMESKNPHWEAHKFVSAIMAKNGKLPSKKVTLK